MDLYQEIMGTNNQQSQPVQNNNNFLNNLSNFAQNFQGDPKQQVMNLIKQRGIDQNTCNNAVQQANQVYNMLRGGKR